MSNVVEALRGQLEDPEFFRHLSDLAQRTAQVRSAYENKRTELTRELEEDLQSHEDELRNRTTWETLDEASRAGLLADFKRIRGRLEDADTSLMELDSHRRGLDTIHTRAVAELVRLTAEADSTPGDGPTPPAICRIPVRHFTATGLRTEQEVETVLKALRGACLEALAKGEIVVLE